MYYHFNKMMMRKKFLNLSDERLKYVDEGDLKQKQSLGGSGRGGRPTPACSVLIPENGRGFRSYEFRTAKSCYFKVTIKRKLAGAITAQSSKLTFHANYYRMTR